ncbi:MAG TPA: Gfo/Idh/MocA family oxidoreductase [Patescibacteria group bacterium]|nr:Gfo/Idh/MocA family oxidoreductase [Patescibacteria group bacterium]
MKVGVIGLGYWGPNLVRNFLSSKDVENVICCDRDEKRLALAKQKFHTVELETDVERLLKRDDVQAIAIATPVFTHFDFAKKALENGKHVLIEKPFTRTVAQADELVQIAERNNRVLMVDHTFLFTDAVQKMKEIIDSGEIGDVMYFDSVRANLGLFQPDVNVVWDLAPHDLSILNYLVGAKPLAVSATGMKHYYDYENIAYVTVYYEESIIAHFHVNWMSPVKIRTICIGGSKKMLYYDDMQTSEKVRVYDKGVDLNSKEGQYQVNVQYRAGDMYAPQIGNREALGGIIQHFIDCINSGEKPISNGEDGRDVVAILEAAELSLKSHGEKILLASLKTRV